jgi:beta-alanine degradation protein BauB
LVVCEGRTAEDGCATLNPMRTILAIGFLSCGLLLAQTGVEVVPIDKEPSHHLVFENEYVRVFSVEVAPHSETKYHQHDRDYVWVSLGDSDVESVRVGAAAVALQPKDGETQFTKGGFAHKAVNKSDKPFRNVTVELKKGIRAEEVECGSGSNMCGGGASGTDHPRSRTTHQFIMRANGISVQTRLHTGKLLVTDCKKNALVIYSALTAIDSAGEEPAGVLFEAGKVRWVPKSTSGCRYWQLSGRYTQIAFD